MLRVNEKWGKQLSKIDIKLQMKNDVTYAINPLMMQQRRFSLKRASVSLKKCTRIQLVRASIKILLNEQNRIGFLPAKAEEVTFYESNPVTSDRYTLNLNSNFKYNVWNEAENNCKLEQYFEKSHGRNDFIHVC